MASTKPKTTRYNSVAYLKNKKDIAAYLDAALEDGDPALIRRALSVVLRVRGVTQIAQDSRTRRDNLYRSLTENGNLKLDTVLKVMRAVGLRLSVDLKSA